MTLHGIVSFLAQPYLSPVMWAADTPPGGDGGYAWMTRPQLMRHLGWLGGAAVDALDEAAAARWLQLAAGEVLYTAGDDARELFVVEAGVALRRMDRDVRTSALRVAFAGSGDVLGCQPPGQPRTETVYAVTELRLMVVPLDVVQRRYAQVDLMAELVCGPISVAVLRDWRVAGQLRDLPSYTRTLAGLRHVLKLDSALGLRVADVGLRLPKAVLQEWLGLDAQRLHATLQQLERQGTLRCDGDVVVSIAPPVLDELNVAAERHRLADRRTGQLPLFKH